MTDFVCVLFLQKVLKYTKDPGEKSVLSSTIKAFVVSLSKQSVSVGINMIHSRVSLQNGERGYSL